MRQGGTLSYLFADQLCSTSVVANSSGSKTAEVRYKAWGEDRYTSGTVPSGYRFTGQRVEATLGLYYYGARWYDSALGRFVQADTVVPSTGDPQAWDRYAYVDNNPVKFVDPTGHMLDQGGGAASMGNDWWRNRQEKFEKNKTTIKSPNKTKDQRVSSSLSYLALSLDATATVLSDVEMGVVDIVGGGAIVAGCIAGPEGCGVGVAFAAGVDVAVPLYSPIGMAENILGGFSFAATFGADVLNGNTSLTGKDSRVGIDTLVSARNMIAGFIPESNFDAAVSNSQFKYDMDRLLGNKTGGSIPLFSNGKFNFGEIFSQMLKSNWW
jgi:RHS repeat-associated protein